MKRLAGMVLALCLLIPTGTSAHTGHLWVEDGVWYHPALSTPIVWVWMGNVEGQAKRDAVRRAIALWDEAPGIFVVRTTNYWRANIRVHTYRADDGNDGITYLYEDGVAEVYLNSRNISGKAETKMVACHEMGHALGLDHNLTGNSCLGYNRYETRPAPHDLKLIYLLNHH
jgi:hypothetical protein